MPYTAGKSNGINWTISSESNDIPRVETCKQFGSAPLCFNQKVNELSVVPARRDLYRTSSKRVHNMVEYVWVCLNKNCSSKQHHQSHSK